MKFQTIVKSALVLGLSIFGAACDDGDDGDGAGAAGGNGAGGGGGAAACGNQGNGQTMCVGDTCQAGQYCNEGFCAPGCTADANCGTGEVCQRNGEAVGVCAPCTPPMTGQGGGGGAGGGAGGAGGGGDDCAAFCAKTDQCTNGMISEMQCQVSGACAAVPSACRSCIIANDCGDINNAGACDAQCDGGGGAGGGGGGGPACAVNCDIDANCDTNNCFNNCCECTFAGCGCDIDADCDSNNCFDNECQLE